MELLRVATCGSGYIVGKSEGSYEKPDLPWGVITGLVTPFLLANTLSLRSNFYRCFVSEISSSAEVIFLETTLDKRSLCKHRLVLLLPPCTHESPLQF